jgi:hypothetical protein
MGVRMAENMAKVGGLGEQIETAYWYGDPATDNKQFRGLSSRYANYLRAAQDNKQIDYNILSAGGASAGKNASIWLLGHGMEGLSAIYPKGSIAGLQHEDKGEERVAALTGSGTIYATVDRYEWVTGLTIKDWRTCGRICNIDIVALEAQTTTSTVLDLIIDLKERVKKMSTTQIWYMPPRVKTALRNGLRNSKQTGIRFDFGNWEGEEVDMIDGTPVRVSDQLLVNENPLTQAS